MRYLKALIALYLSASHLYAIDPEAEDVDILGFSSDSEEGGKDAMAAADLLAISRKYALTNTTNTGLPPKVRWKIESFLNEPTDTANLDTIEHGKKLLNLTSKELVRSMIQDKIDALSKVFSKDSSLPPSKERKLIEIDASN